MLPPPPFPPPHPSPLPVSLGFLVGTAAFWAALAPGAGWLSYFGGMAMVAGVGSAVMAAEGDHKVEIGQ